MLDIVRRISSSENSPITYTDEQIVSDKNSRYERSAHARRKDKSIPKTFDKNKNSTEMTANKGTQCSNKDKQGNCLYSTDWSSECIDDVLNCNVKANNHKSSSTDTFYPTDYKYLTSKHQQNRISQSSNNQKSALTQCKSNTNSSSNNNKCKNKKESNLTVNMIQNCQEVNKRSKRLTVPIILSQTSIILLCAFVLVLGTRFVDAVTKDGSK